MDGLLIAAALLIFPLFVVLRAGVFGFLAAVAPLFTLVAIFQDEIKAHLANFGEMRGSYIQPPLGILDLPWIWIAVASWGLLVIWRMAMWWGLVPGWTGGSR